MSIELLHERLDDLEKRIRRTNQTAPTFPIYDMGRLPQDAINGQIALGTDGSLNCFVVNTWYTKIGSSCNIGIIPQDILEGQIIIGTDDSLCYFVNGTWYGFGPTNCSGRPPQDSVEGQIAIQQLPTSTLPIIWFSNNIWRGIA